MYLLDVWRNNEKRYQISKMEALIVYQDEIPILVDESLNFSTVDTFSRGFHMYIMKDTNPIGEVLEVVKEPDNEYDPSDVAIKRTTVFPPL